MRNLFVVLFYERTNRMNVYTVHVISFSLIVWSRDTYLVRMCLYFECARIQFYHHNQLLGVVVYRFIIVIADRHIVRFRSRLDTE